MSCTPEVAYDFDAVKTRHHQINHEDRLRVAVQIRAFQGFRVVFYDGQRFAFERGTDAPTGLRAVVDDGYGRRHINALKFDSWLSENSIWVALQLHTTRAL